MDRMVLDRWNQATEQAAAREVLPCNGSRAWAEALARGRPFREVAELLKAADAAWRNLSVEQWQEAFDSHPRIGEQHAKSATEASLRWSAGEQSAAAGDVAIKADLAAGNRRYEQQFGRVFIVCATGRTAAQMLAILRARLGADAESELQETAEQQRRITQLRLRKWLGLPPVRCEDV